METPTNINNLKEEGCLEVHWREGGPIRIPFFTLRDACACAHCVHELTGEKILDRSRIPEDIHIESMDLVGAYALKIRWSDGHDTGLFTWERLREFV